MADVYVATTGNDTTGDGSSGNPYATPGKGAGDLSAGEVMWVKTGTYALSTSTPGAGGPVVIPADTQCRMEGYFSATGDGGDYPDNKPVIEANAETEVNLVTLDGNYATGMPEVRYIKVDGMGNATVNGIYSTATYSGDRGAVDCEASNCVIGFRSIVSIRNKANACATGFYYCWANGCFALSCTTVGFDVSVAACTNSIARLCQIGFKVNYTAPAVNCVAHGSTGHGFDPTYSMVVLVNCLSVRSGGSGFDTLSAQQQMYNCAGYLNTSGDIVHALDSSRGFISLSADPFDSGSPTDFRVNNTSGGGADCRGAGIATFGQTGNTDIGAVQHADPSSSVFIMPSRPNSLLRR